MTVRSPLPDGPVGLIDIENRSGAQLPKAFGRLATELAHTKVAQEIGSGTEIRTPNLAANGSLRPVQKSELEFAECLSRPPFCHGLSPAWLYKPSASDGRCARRPANANPHNDKIAGGSLSDCLSGLRHRRWGNRHGGLRAPYIERKLPTSEASTSKGRAPD